MHTIDNTPMASLECEHYYYLQCKLFNDSTTESSVILGGKRHLCECNPSF